MNYRFIYFYILFVLALNFWVGLYDSSMQQELNINPSNEGQTSSIFSTIGIFFDIAFFGIFSPSIPFVLSALIWFPAGILVIIGMAELIAIFIP